MKNFILKISILLTLIIAASSPSFSQTPRSTTVGKNETVAFLIRQNETARDVIAAQEKRIADLEALNQVERENSASLAKSYEAAKSEISSLKQSNEALSRAVAINEQTVELLKTDNAEQREKSKKATRDKWKAIAVAAGLIILKVASRKTSMKNENTSQSDESKSWYSELSWKNALLSSLLALAIGGGGGGLVASKAAKAEGLTQEAADVRYLTIEAADKRAAKRDSQTDRIEIKIDELTKKLDEKYVRKDVFDQNNESVKILLNQILENQKSSRSY